MPTWLATIIFEDHIVKLPLSGDGCPKEGVAPKGYVPCWGLRVQLQHTHRVLCPTQRLLHPAAHPAHMCEGCRSMPGK